MNNEIRNEICLCVCVVENFFLLLLFFFFFFFFFLSAWKNVGMTKHWGKINPFSSHFSSFITVFFLFFFLQFFLFLTKFIYIHENMDNQNHCMSIKQARLIVNAHKHNLLINSFCNNGCV